MWSTLASLLGRIGRFVGESLEHADRALCLMTEPMLDPDDDDPALEVERAADRLLREMLGPSYAALKEPGYVDVPSSLFPDTFYRLRMRQLVEVYTGGHRVARLCAVANQPVPAQDQFLIKLLWLRADEAHLLAAANVVRR